MERWGFIVPWCSVLRKRIQYYHIAREEDVWDIHKHSLDVILPTRRGDELNEYTNGREEVGTGDDNYAITHATSNDKEAAFQAKFKRVTEALALLAAVAHVDQTAWKYLLKRHCEVSFGVEVLQDGSEKCEREIPAHFVLHMDHGGTSGMPCNINSVDMEPTELVDIDLVQLCGVRQWENPSAEYLETLAKIAGLDPHFGPERKGVEVIITVQVQYYSGRSRISQWELANIAKACRVINEQWEAYERGTEKPEVQSGSFRCTFLLVPISAEVTDGMGLTFMSPAMEAVFRNNTWFSELTLSAEMHNHTVVIDGTEAYSEYVDEDQAGAEYRQLMAAVFGTTRRTPGAATARYYSDHSNVFQIETLDFTTSRQLEESDLKAMTSALAFNHTAKKVSIRSEIGTIGGRNTWKWLAYGLFSKRAAEYSSLESFAITDVISLSRADMEKFIAVLTSDHPEEILCNTPRGLVEEREATLKPGAPVHWQFRKYASSCDDTLAFETHIAHLRTFSDDGVSEWVAAIVPGVGPCHVRRQDLAM